MRNEIQNIIDSIKLPSKEFTREFKSLCKNWKCSPYWFDMNLEYEEAENIFNAFSKIVRDSNESNATKLNAFRIAKHAVLRTDFIRKHQEEAFELFLCGILSDDGNIRHEAVRFFHNIDFGYETRSLNNKELERKLYEAVSHLFLQLRKIHDEYECTHANKLLLRDRTVNGSIPHSSDTKNSFLKTLRKFFEYIDMYAYHERFYDYGVSNLSELNALNI